MAYVRRQPGALLTPELVYESILNAPSIFGDDDAMHRSQSERAKHALARAV